MLLARIAVACLVVMFTLTGCGGSSSTDPSDNEDSTSQTDGPTVKGVIGAFADDDLPTKELGKQYAVCSYMDGCDDGVALVGVTVEIYETADDAKAAQKQYTSKEFNSKQLPAYRAGVVVLDWDSNVSVIKKATRAKYAKALHDYVSEVS